MPMTGFQAFGQLAPGRNRVLAPAATLAFALSTAHRMVDRIHHHATDVGPAPQPAGPTRLAETDLFVRHIADLANGGIAVRMEPANFTGRKLEQGVIPVDCRANRGGSGRTNNLTAPSRNHFDVVERKPLGNGP